MQYLFGRSAQVSRDESPTDLQQFFRCKVVARQAWLAPAQHHFFATSRLRMFISQPRGVNPELPWPGSVSRPGSNLRLGEDSRERHRRIRISLLLYYRVSPAGAGVLRPCRIRLCVGTGFPITCKLGFPDATPAGQFVAGSPSAVPIGAHNVRHETDVLPNRPA